MSKVTYDNLLEGFLSPTHIYLQMVDETIRLPEGVARDILVKIKNDYIPADFIIRDMGADEEIPLILGSLSQHYRCYHVGEIGTNRLSILRMEGKVCFQ